MLSAQQYLTQNSMTLCPTLPTHPISPQATDFLFSQMEALFKRKHFANVEEVKQNTTEALKGIKIDEFRNIMMGILHQMESTLKVTEV